jgi:UDP-N-acetylglucosamine enolpyruvyl transferase
MNSRNSKPTSCAMGAEIRVEHGDVVARAARLRGAVIVTDKRVTPEGHKTFVANEIKALSAVIEAAGQFAD